MARLFRRTNSPQGRAENIDELTRLNRGYGTFTGEDAGEQPSYILPFQRTAKMGLEPSIQQTKQRSLPEAPVYEDIPEETDQPLSLEPGTIDDFLNQHNPTVDPIGSTPDGGLILPDGTAVYEDGTIKNQQGQIIYGMASIPGGYTMYSDGSVRRGGLENLIQGIFGRLQTITQGYGNQNAGMGYANNTHRGTDIRTRDLPDEPQYLPDDVQVMEVLQDNGSGTGYGNSLLVKLPSGEMLRFSHLSQLPNVQVGQQISAGTPFILPGSTGNSTAEHLDLEYYNADGQLSDPATFQGFTNARQGIGTQLPPEMMTPELQRVSEQIRANPPSQPQQPMQSQPNQPQQGQILGAQDQAPMPRPQQPVIEPTSQIPLVTPPSVTPRPQLGTAVNQAGRDLNLPVISDPQGFAGIGEMFAGNRRLAGQETNQTGQRYGLPALGIGEAQAGDYKGAARELGSTISSAIEKRNPTPGVDFGGTELIRGDVEGAKKNFETMLGRVMKRFGDAPGQLMDSITPDAYAADTRPGQVLGATDQAQAVADQGTQMMSRFVTQNDTAMNRSGAGMDKLKGLFSRNNIMSRPNMSDLGSDKAVGNSPSGNLLGSTTPQMASSMKEATDTRDPFFKGTGATDFSRFINPEASNNRSLSMGMFNSEFFQDKGRVGQVFGGTAMEGEAMGKYQAYEDEQRRIAEEEARKAAQSQPSLQDYLNMGKSVDQWFAETGRQGELDDLRRQQKSNEMIIDQYKGQSSEPTKQLFPGSGYSAKAGSQPVSQQSMNTLSQLASQAKGTNYKPTPAAAAIDNSPPAQSSSASLAPRPQSQPQPSLFERAKDAVIRFFRR